MLLPAMCRRIRSASQPSKAIGTAWYDGARAARLIVFYWTCLQPHPQSATRSLPHWISKCRMNRAGYGRALLMPFADETWIQQPLTRYGAAAGACARMLVARLTCCCSWRWRILSARAAGSGRLLGKLGSQPCFVPTAKETTDSGQLVLILVP